MGPKVQATEDRARSRLTPVSYTNPSSPGWTPKNPTQRPGIRVPPRDTLTSSLATPKGHKIRDKGATSRKPTELPASLPGSEKPFNETATHVDEPAASAASRDAAPVLRRVLERTPRSAFRRTLNRISTPFGTDRFSPPKSEPASKLREARRRARFDGEPLLRRHSTPHPRRSTATSDARHDATGDRRAPSLEKSPLPKERGQRSAG